MFRGDRKVEIKFKTVAVPTRDLRAELVASLLDAGYLESQLEEYLEWAQAELSADLLGTARLPKPVPRGRKPGRLLTSAPSGVSRESDDAE
jgi:hypothetical protein